MAHGLGWDATKAAHGHVRGARTVAVAVPRVMSYLQNWAGSFAVIFGTVLVQFGVQTLLLHLFDIRLRRRPAPPGHHLRSHRLLGTFSLLVVFVLIAGHLVQVGLWTLLYRSLGEFRSLADAIYFSLANFTTIGAAELELSRRHRVLGALEGGVGMLMFGWSTALLVALVVGGRREEEAERRSHAATRKPGQPE
ncbi:MAG TPA: ion channel [Crenalkalicoccus sp.]|nr:ion channel [Crenalkalicoccus sp.]